MSEEDTKFVDQIKNRIPVLHTTLAPLVISLERVATKLQETTKCATNLGLDTHELIQDRMDQELCTMRRLNQVPVIPSYVPLLFLIIAISAPPSSPYYHSAFILSIVLTSASWIMALVVPAHMYEKLEKYLLLNRQRELLLKRNNEKI